VPAIVDRNTGATLMLVDDSEEAETIMVELRRSGILADVEKRPPKQVRDPNWD
jgi:hypothetical protein